MKHFLSKVDSMSKQVFDMAIITNSKGKKVGKIIVRYTDSIDRWNNETGIVLNGILSCNKTEKHSVHNNTMGIYNLLKSANAKIFDKLGNQIINYDMKQNDNTVYVDCIGRVTEFEKFKIGNKKYSILWV